MLSPAESSLEHQFELDSVRGELRVVGGLDREQAETVRLAVRVEDVNARDSPQVAEAIVTVVIEDVNDNRPAFSRQLYMASVVENSAKGTPITR